MKPSTEDRLIRDACAPHEYVTGDLLWNQHRGEWQPADVTVEHVWFAAGDKVLHYWCPAERRWLANAPSFTAACTGLAFTFQHLCNEVRNALRGLIRRWVNE